MSVNIRFPIRPGKFYQQFFIYLAILLIAASHTAIHPSRFILDDAPELQSHIHPVLLSFANTEPNRPVRVIVQTTTNNEEIKDRILKTNGKLITDLPIISAFVAELEAQYITELGKVHGVRWISWDAPVVSTACTQCVDTTKLASAYIRAVRADTVWNQSPYRQGQGIGVAVVDSGVNPQDDFYTKVGQSRIVASVALNNGYNTSIFDNYGHGSHVAGVIGGNGRKLNGTYIGVAPKVNLINVKVGDDLNKGQGTASTVVAGLQWILQNKNTYNIRVVNMSLNSSVAESYHTNPINAAVEILWFNKIVVVVSAGNAGAGALYPPANDPFVITVGATDDRGTNSISDDTIPNFSAYGTTIDGFQKPDLVAPGTNIVGLTGNVNQGMQAEHPENVTANGAYFKLSGTSAAAPVVTGAVALLLEDEPGLTPDQVKYRLMSTANKSWSGYSTTQGGAGYLDIYAAVTGSSTESANTDINASALLWSGSQAVTWGSVNWNSVNWNSVNWNSVNWNSVNWNSVNWNSDYWGTASSTSATATPTSVISAPTPTPTPGPTATPKSSRWWRTSEEMDGKPMEGDPSVTGEVQTEEQSNFIFLPIVSR